MAARPKETFKSGNIKGHYSPRYAFGIQQTVMPKLYKYSKKEFDALAEKRLKEEREELARH